MLNMRFNIPCNDIYKSRHEFRNYQIFCIFFRIIPLGGIVFRFLCEKSGGCIIGRVVDDASLRWIVPEGAGNEL